MAIGDETEADAILGDARREIVQSPSLALVTAQVCELQANESASLTMATVSNNKKRSVNKRWSSTIVTF
jgi:hypothetical protein